MGVASFTGRWRIGHIVGAALVILTMHRGRW
jgi:hypothetical protein